MDRTIRVWRTEPNNTELLLQIDAHQDCVASVVWSPDGQQLLSASYDKTAKFWDSSTGLQIGQPCTGHTRNIFHVAISVDGSFIATASHDKTVRLWSTETHKQIGRALEHSDRVVCLAISPNGALLINGGEDGKVRLWSIKNTIEQYKAEERRKYDREHEQHRLLAGATVIVRRRSLYDLHFASNHCYQNRVSTLRVHVRCLFTARFTADHNT